MIDSIGSLLGDRDYGQGSGPQHRNLTGITATVADARAHRMMIAVGGTQQSWELYCKAAYCLSESEIESQIEAARQYGLPPARLFTYLVKKAIDAALKKANKPKGHRG